MSMSIIIGFVCFFFSLAAGVPLTTLRPFNFLVHRLCALSGPIPHTYTHAYCSYFTLFDALLSLVLSPSHDLFCCLSLLLSLSRSSAVRCFRLQKHCWSVRSIFHGFSCCVARISHIRIYRDGPKRWQSAMSQSCHRPRRPDVVVCVCKCVCVCVCLVCKVFVDRIASSNEPNEFCCVCCGCNSGNALGTAGSGVCRKDGESFLPLCVCVCVYVCLAQKHLALAIHFHSLVDFRPFAQIRDSCVIAVQMSFPR